MVDIGGYWWTLYGALRMNMEPRITSASLAPLLNIAQALQKSFGNAFVELSQNPNVLLLANWLYIDRSWKTSTVIDLAKAQRLQWEPDWLPIIYDALLEAGCDNDFALTAFREKDEAACRLLIGVILGV
jgi:hypothetical protein